MKWAIASGVGFAFLLFVPDIVVLAFVAIHELIELDFDNMVESSVFDLTSADKCSTPVSNGLEESADEGVISG